MKNNSKPKFLKKILNKFKRKTLIEKSTWVCNQSLRLQPEGLLFELAYITALYRISL